MVSHGEPVPSLNVQHLPPSVNQDPKAEQLLKVALDKADEIKDTTAKMVTLASSIKQQIIAAKDWKWLCTIYRGILDGILDVGYLVFLVVVYDIICEIKKLIDRYKEYTNNRQSN